MALLDKKVYSWQDNVTKCAGFYLQALANRDKHVDRLVRCLYGPGLDLTKGGITNSVSPVIRHWVTSENNPPGAPTL